MKILRKKNRLSGIVAIGLTLWSGMCFGAWTYNPSLRTLTDGVCTLTNVTYSGTNLTIGSNNVDTSIVPTNAIMDFNEPITDADGKTYTITELGNYAFRNRKMKSIVPLLPSSITKIGAQVFRGCDNLEGDVVIENMNSSSIGAAWFREAKKITSVKITATENCKTINGTVDARVFADCLACTNIWIDAPALTSSGFTAITNRNFYRCNALVDLSILSSNVIEMVDDTYRDPLPALRSITFSGPACTEDTMDVLIGMFNSSARPNSQIRVSTRQKGWRTLATPLSELTDEEKASAPQGAFGRFYKKNTSSWVWAVNEPSKYDVDDGVGVVTIEGALGVAVGAPTPSYQESTEMTMGDTLALSAPNWEDPNTAYRYVCESIAVYTWNSDVGAWNEPTITDGNALDYTVVEGRQKIRFNYVLDTIPALEVAIQGNDSCSVTFDPEPVDGYIKAGMVTLTATSTDDVPFGRWIGVGLTEEQKLNPVLTVDATTASSILAVFNTPWVLMDDGKGGKKITDGLWHFPVTVNGTKLTVQKRATELIGHVLDLSKPIEPEGYTITAIGDTFAKDASVVVTKEVILPTTLESIGKEAFYARNDITNFVLNCPSLKTIGVSAFRQCTGNRSSASKWDLSSVTTLRADAMREMGMRGELDLPSLTSVESGALRSISTLSRAEICANIREIPDLLFYYVDITNLTLRSSATGMTYRVFEGTKSFNVVLDMPNLEVWGYQTPGMTHLTNIEYRTSKQLRIMEKESVTKKFEVANLKTALFSGPLPTAEFMNLMLSKPANYQVTLIASKRQDGWANDSHISDCDDTEFATYQTLWPDETKRPKIYKSDNNKKAFIRWQKSVFDKQPLILIIR